MYFSKVYSANNISLKELVSAYKTKNSEKDV